MHSQDTNDLRKIADIISTKISENDIAAKTYYRLKDPCSALNKIILKTNELTDLVAFRFIVDKLEDCYKVLDIIRGIYSVKTTEKKNYIDYPKGNGYRSLHMVTSVGDPRRNVEMQVRTNEMHDIAEFGTANHEEYKKTQEAKIRKFLPSSMLNIAGINTELNKAYDIFSQFNWTIQELIAYEQTIINLYRIYQDSLREIQSNLEVALDNPNNQNNLQVRNTLGIIYDSFGDGNKAIEQYKYCLRMHKLIHKDQPHPDVAASLNNLGAAYHAKGQYDQAIKYYQESLKIREVIYKDQPHPDIAASLNNLGNAYIDKGQYDQAMKYYKTSIWDKVII